MGQLKDIHGDLRLFARYGPHWAHDEALNDDLGRCVLRLDKLGWIAKEQSRRAWERRVANHPARPLPPQFLVEWGSGPRHFHGISCFLCTSIAQAAGRIHHELAWPPRNHKETTMNRLKHVHPALRDWTTFGLIFPVYGNPAPAGFLRGTRLDKACCQVLAAWRRRAAMEPERPVPPTFLRKYQDLWWVTYRLNTPLVTAVRGLRESELARLQGKRP